MEKIKCNKCGYVWKTKSKLLTVSCPSCGSKVRINNKTSNGAVDE